MFKLYPPALIYLCFSLVQVIINTINGLYEIALYKSIAMIIITFLLNTLSANNLDIIAWIIVFIPFILMTEIFVIILYTFSIDMVNKPSHSPPHSSTTNTNTNTKTPPAYGTSPAYESFI
jgi:predicted membrane protein